MIESEADVKAAATFPSGLSPQVAINDKKMYPLYAACVELDIPIFINAGVPAVEFGPVGGGHHGPGEWVSISSLERYRSTIVDFVRRVPEQMTGDKPHLRIA